MPHETQNVPQDSLPLTPRPPIEGEPNACKQEATDGIVIAERTIGTVKTAEPCKTVADIDRTALLGGEPAERVCGVDESDRKERKPQSRLQQTNLYCKEGRQHNENAIRDVPNVHGLLLEGEWDVCASGETSNLNGVESEGCGGGTSGRASIDELETLVECCQQLCMASGDRDREVERVDAPHELMQLQAMLIESEDPYSGGILRVHLGSTNWRAGSANGPGRETDGLRGQADGRRGWTDTLSVSHSAETTGMSNGEGAGTYLGAGGANHLVNATDGIGSQLDALSGHWDVPSIETDAITPENAPENVSIPRKREKPPDSPMETAKWTPDVPNGSRSHADASSVHTDTHCAGNETETTENAPKNVRTCRIERKAENSPNGRDIAMPEVARRWRMVSVEEVHVYVPYNVPIASPSRNIVFGQVESGVEAIAPIVEGERAGDGDGSGYGDDGDVDDTTSGGDIDSK